MQDDEDSDREPYEVGYGKPPAEHRFKPGQSGNPKGRPKGSRGLKYLLGQELDARWIIQINGKPVSGTKQALMIKALTARAASGDLKAITKVVELVQQVFGVEDRGQGPARLSQRDEALLKDFLEGRAETTAESGKGDEASSDAKSGNGGDAGGEAKATDGSEARGDTGIDASQARSGKHDGSQFETDPQDSERLAGEDKTEPPRKRKARDGSGRRKQKSSDG